MRFFALAIGTSLLPLWALGAPPNQAPTIAPIAAQTVDENDDLTVTITATDPEGDDISIVADSLPPNASFTDNGDGTALLEFSPDFEQAGLVEIKLNANDNGVPSAGSSAIISITVANVNRLPIINAQATLETTVGQTASVSFSALDPDGDEVLFSGVNLPGNMTITNSGNSSAVIEYTPSADEVGESSVTINADDGNQIVPILLDVVVNAGPDEGRCSVSHASSSSVTAFWALLVGALVLRRRRG